MIRVHVLLWICGAPVWVWRKVTLIEWARMTNYTAAMVKLKAAKLAAGGAIVICASSGAYYGPGLVSPDTSPIVALARPEQPVDVPEPSAWSLLAVGIVGLAIGKRRQ